MASSSATQLLPSELPLRCLCEKSQSSIDFVIAFAAFGSLEKLVEESVMVFRGEELGLLHRERVRK